ncbi:hypothetical protein, partial [Paenibacillus sp. P22]|uniref:hypothetical protein n=1 Tax=Paenibacillus sp. P22 TaxID=483908 RepID=UPI0004345F89
MEKIFRTIILISTAATLVSCSKASDSFSSNSSDNGGIFRVDVRGNHPRSEGIWPQYEGLQTALGKNVVITDVVTPDMKFENWKGEEMEAHD